MPGDAESDENMAAVGGDDEEFDAYECAFCTSDAVINKNKNGPGRSVRQPNQREAGEKPAAFDHQRVQILPPGSVGLESMSTVEIFGEKSLLTNTRRVRSTIRAICNTDSLIFMRKGTFGWYGDVWYYPRAIANIIFLQNVQKQHRVTFDSGGQKSIPGVLGDGTARAFTPTDKVCTRRRCSETLMRSSV